jgi:hypothetical protein
LGALGVLGYVGLGAALGLVTLGMVSLWAARHRAEGERVSVPRLGEVGSPTCLTVGLCCMVGGYHVAAYSLAPAFVLVSVPPERWWLVALAIGAAVVGSLLADRLEGGG